MSPCVHLFMCSDLDFVFSDRTVVYIAPFTKVIPERLLSVKDNPLSGPARELGCPSPIPILIAHLLFNIKKITQSPNFFFMQNQGYTILLA